MPWPPLAALARGRHRSPALRAISSRPPSSPAAANPATAPGGDGRAPDAAAGCRLTLACRTRRGRRDEGGRPRAAPPPTTQRGQPWQRQRASQPERPQPCAGRRWPARGPYGPRPRRRRPRRAAYCRRVGAAGRGTTLAALAALAALNLVLANLADHGRPAATAASGRA
eukprot:5032514-Prymnesium_polylepis.1